ncbi:MAG: ABC transporter permease [bacterium]
MMRVVDTFMAFPVLIVASALAVTLGSGLYPVILAVGLILWTRFARITRGDVLAIKQEEFIESAEAIGENRFNIMVRYILFNTLPSIMVIATIMMPTALLYAAALNYLGIGVQPPTPAWGEMINSGKDFIEYRPWQVIFPGLAIMITVLAFNFLGDGLRDAADPFDNG